MIKLLFNRKVNVTLANLSAGGRLPHALLFEGPAGTGKKTAAALFAQSALCTAENKPCGVCPHCQKVEKGVHPDVRYYTVPEGKRDFPVEQIREIRQDAYISPNEGRCKVYIIDKAHAMNAAAQNALLKLIEEPPEFVYFVLLSENRSLMLPTILSRVISVEFEAPGVEGCMQALQTLRPELSEQERRAAAAGAGGNIGQALALIGSAKPSKYASDAERLRELLIFGNRYEALKLLCGYDKDREGLLQMFALLKEGFAQWIRSHWQEKNEMSERFFNRIPAAKAAGVLDAIEQAAVYIRQNGSIPLISAFLVEKIKGMAS